jgi:hypothetical protein
MKRQQQPPPKRRSLRVTGLVDLAGKFKPDDPGLFKLSFLYYAGKRVEFEPVPEGERRTLAQNRFWHAVLKPAWWDYWKKQHENPDMSLAEAHHRAVAHMLGRHTSKGLTIAEFDYLCRQSEVFLRERGYEIPTRDEPLPDNPDHDMPESLT